MNYSNELKPNIQTKDLSSLFSFTFDSDNGVAFNKRGSGLKKALLLSYFMVQAEKEASGRPIIYGIEEPENSQHPNHQIEIINAIISLSENYQVFVTTHSPNLAKKVNEKNIIFIQKDSASNHQSIYNGNKKAEEIIDTLGILPDLEISSKVKVAVCVEGYTDIHFLQNINQQIEEFKEIIDLSDETIALLPMGGDDVKHWVNNKYLKQFNLKEFHLYDSDIHQEKKENRHKYRKYFDEIKQSGNIALEKNFSETENYLHPKILIDGNHCNSDCANFSDYTKCLNIWQSKDVKECCKQKPKKYKENITSTYFKNMTLELFKELEATHSDTEERITAFDEIKGWFEKIKELMDSSNDHQ